ncbi:MAG TPA: Zn-dependent alcohol dehydrogenase [Candidatus Dormibacteraeota bacterium]|jgi:S-(hydroxymethyl)glutathione dehydrogenase/alcohol dehydrogenase|nr:Zn-dependent alcohol dehydrogenase [Candidatus Dormibacteraeota bacterium]
MQAAVLRNLNEPFEITEVEIGEPQAGEVLVRMQASGVCHSDLSVIEGVIPFMLPMVGGHEGAGIVEAVGSGVTKVQPGDHVIISWVATCEKCFFCTHDQPQLCQSGLAAFGNMDDGTTRLKIGDETIYHGLNAATFAEHTIVRETAVVKIPDDIPFGVAAMVGCGVTTGVGAAVHTGAVQEGERVAVIGAGGVGLSVIQGAKIAGATTIIAIDPVETRRAAALKFGATDAVEAGEGATEKVKEMTDGMGVDVAFEVVGKPPLQQQAYDMTRAGGRTILVGMPSLEGEVTINSFFMIVGEKQLKGSFYGSARPSKDFPWILDQYRQGRLDLDSLATQTLPLDRINEAFDAMRAGEQLRTVIALGPEAGNGKAG